MSADHPSWCDLDACNAKGMTGSHRSQPSTVDPFTVNLISDASAPDDVRVELRMALPHRTAYTIGRLLVQLGKQANRANGPQRD